MASLEITFERIISTIKRAGLLQGDKETDCDLSGEAKQLTRTLSMLKEWAWQSRRV